MKEPLARFHMKDGKAIDMYREEGDVSIDSPDHLVTIPQATGQQTLDWIALFEAHLRSSLSGPFGLTLFYNWLRSGKVPAGASFFQATIHEACISRGVTSRR